MADCGHFLIKEYIKFGPTWIGVDESVEGDVGLENLTVREETKREFQ